MCRDVSMLAQDLYSVKIFKSYFLVMSATVLEVYLGYEKRVGGVNVTDSRINDDKQLMDNFKYF